jgi:hypothetical protein
MLHSAHSSQIDSSAQSTQPTTVSESTRPEDSLRVLLAVRLEEDFFLENEDEDDGKRIRTWCNWLKAIPDGVQNVAIEGIYKSCSAPLVLLTVPIVLWDLLPNNTAYSFIGFVKPNNWSKADLARLQLAVGDSKLNKLTSAAYIPPNPEPKERLKQYNGSPTSDVSPNARPAATKYHKTGPDSRRTELSGYTSSKSSSRSQKRSTPIREEKEAEELDDFIGQVSPLLV